MIARMSFTLDCNHRDVLSNGGMALHYTNVYIQMLADTCTDIPNKPAHTPDTTGIIPNVTIVTPKIVALTNRQRLSSNLEDNRVGNYLKHFTLQPQLY